LILPAAIFLKVMPRDHDRYRQAQVLVVFGVFIMLAVVAFTIVDVATG
jgi:hypothetical protein